jgi:hypothetical protein
VIPSPSKGGLPSPTSRLTPQDSITTTPVHQPYHYSQPELRHHNNDTLDRLNHPDHHNHVRNTNFKKDHK